VFQCTCLVTGHAHEVPKQKPLGLERNGGQVEEMAEAEEELCKRTGSGDEVRIGMGSLRGVCPTRKIRV
jgi:hypothetical protein